MSQKALAPTHSKAPHYLRSGLFDGLTSFRELETQISNLPTTKERGDAFEVFTESYLATVAVERATSLVRRTFRRLFANNSH